jgi:hypothetical protein
MGFEFRCGGRFFSTGMQIGVFINAWLSSYV